MSVELLVPAPERVISGIGPYSIPHPYEAETIVVVVIDGADRLILPTGAYTVTPDASTTTGDVYLTAPTAALYAGASLFIQRDTAEEQGWVGLLGERERGLEAQLDRMVMVDQELADAQQRTFRTDRPMPPFVVVPGAVLMFDAGGVPVSGPLAADIAEAEANAAAATTAAAEASASAAIAADAAALYQGLKLPQMFGAVGGNTDDRAALQAFVDARGGRITMSHRVAGPITTRSGLKIEGDPAAILYQTAKSNNGSFVENATAVIADRIQSGLVFRDLNISGELLPDPFKFTLTAAGTTLNVPLPAGASTVDGAYVGLLAQFMNGAASIGAGLRFVTAYNGATRTATVSSAFPGAPQIGDTIHIGWNDNAYGFADGMSDLIIDGGVVRGYPAEKQVPAGQGAKGADLEAGGRNISVSNVTFYDLNQAIFVSGDAGTRPNGVPSSELGIRLIGNHAENCGSLLTIANLDGVSGIPDTDNEQQIIATGLTYKNCGHAPWKIVTTGQEKCSIVNLMGANGASISDVRGYNEGTYPTNYPTDYPNRAGYGLSGNVGSAIGGHARNCTISEFHHGGNLDAAVHIGRRRALGDDAPPTGVVSGMRGWNINGLYIYGAVNQVISRDEANPFTGSEITGHWRIEVATATTLLPTGMITATLLVLDITEVASGKRVIGTPRDILLRGNTFADYPDGVTDLRQMDRRTVTIAAGAAYSFTPLRSFGTLEIASDVSQVVNMVAYRVGASPQCRLYSPVAGMAAAVIPLTGTTGVSGDVTIAATPAGTIAIENRRTGPMTAELSMRTH